MNSLDMDAVVDHCIDNIKSTLSAKAVEYSRNADRLHNFKRAANVADTTPAKALLGMMLKHEVSILDMVDDDESGVHASGLLLDEKFGDIINYYILLKALLLEPDDCPEEERS